MKLEEIGKYAFTVFVLVAIIMGLVTGYMKWQEMDAYADTIAWVTLVMLILGVIVGLTMITAKEVTPFLIAAIALAVISGGAFSSLGAIHDLLGYWATDTVNLIVAFVAPAAVILAIKSVLALAKEK